MVKKVIMDLDSSKTSGPDCIPVVVLKNCEPELSYILAELFNMCRDISRLNLIAVDRYGRPKKYTQKCLFVAKINMLFSC